MKTNNDFVQCALLPKWDKYKYNNLDCQGYVEAVLKDIGVRKSDGSYYNWTGSNSMFRNYFTWHGLIDDCIKKYGALPAGSFVYVWKKTGEPDKYKNDGLGNFSHVGIYCGNNIVRDSTRSTTSKRDGVGTRTLDGFTYCSLFSGIDYTGYNKYNQLVDNLLLKIDNIHNELIDLEGTINELFRSKSVD